MYVRAYVTLGNIIHSISRGRTVNKCWNLVHLVQLLTSINDGTQMLTFRGLTTVAIFRILDFLWVSIVLIYEWNCFLFPDWLHLFHLFSELRTHSHGQEISQQYTRRDIFCALDTFALDENVYLTALPVLCKASPDLYNAPPVLCNASQNHKRLAFIKIGIFNSQTAKNPAKKILIFGLPSRHKIKITDLKK